VQRVSLP